MSKHNKKRNSAKRKDGILPEGGIVVVLGDDFIEKIVGSGARAADAEQPGKKGDGGKSGKNANADKSDKTDKPGKTDKSGKTDKPGKADNAEKAGKAGKKRKKALKRAKKEIRAEVRLEMERRLTDEYRQWMVLLVRDPRDASHDVPAYADSGHFDAAPYMPFVPRSQDPSRRPAANAAHREVSDLATEPLVASRYSTAARVTAPAAAPKVAASAPLRIHPVYEEALHQPNLSERAILSYLAEHPTATQSQVSGELHISRSTVADYTSSLQSKGLLTREGSRRSGYWVVHGRAGDFAR